MCVFCLVLNQQRSPEDRKRVSALHDDHVTDPPPTASSVDHVSSQDQKMIHQVSTKHDQTLDQGPYGSEMILVVPQPSLENTKTQDDEVDSTKIASCDGDTDKKISAPVSTLSIAKRKSRTMKKDAQKIRAKRCRCAIGLIREAVLGPNLTWDISPLFQDVEGRISQLYDWAATIGLSADFSSKKRTTTRL